MDVKLMMMMMMNIMDREIQEFQVLLKPDSAEEVKSEEVSIF